MGILRDTPIHTEEQYTAVDDLHLRAILTNMANRYSIAAQALIYSTYQDTELHRIYRAIRASGEFQHGGKTKVRRKVIEYPNHFVYDFVNTVMSTMYGPDWMKNRQAVQHELVKPWHVVNNL